jgi:ferredoxin
MPTVRYDGRSVECERGAVLRDVLLEAGADVHNGAASTLNCGGLGTCGTCAVAVDGETSPRTRRESWRLDFPPHDADADLRLACQTRVEGDLTVSKYPGFWGQHVEQATETDDE